MEKYSIIGMGHVGRFNDFDDAILVKVIPADFLDYYENQQDEDDYEDTINQVQRWLMFKNYPGKEEWLERKLDNCELHKFWDIDFEKFVPKMTTITNNRTGDSFLRSIYQVIMVEENLDVVEASEKGISYKGRSGHQQILDNLGLILVGSLDCRYYLLNDDLTTGSAYAIPYEASAANGNFM